MNEANLYLHLDRPDDRVRLTSAECYMQSEDEAGTAAVVGLAVIVLSVAMVAGVIAWAVWA